MFGKVVAASVIAVWLALFGIEFFEDLGVIHYSTPGMDDAMDQALDGFGSAIASSTDSTRSTPTSLFFSYQAVYSFAAPHFSYDGAWGFLGWVWQTQSLRKKLKINKLHQVFLI